MIRAVAVAAALLSLTSVQPAAAQDSPLAVGLQGGVPGVGLSAEFWLTRGLVLRGSYDLLEMGRGDSYDDIDYQAKIDFKSPGAFVEWHPTASALMISAGAYFGDRNIKLDAAPAGTTNIGGVNYTASQVGTLNGEIKLASTAPFVGVGYDNTFTGMGRWGLRAVVGAAVGDAPQVNLSSNGGTLSNDATFRARLADEANSIQADAEDYKILPVVQLGLTYRF